MFGNCSSEYYTAHCTEGQEGVQKDDQMRNEGKGSFSQIFKYFPLHDKKKFQWGKFRLDNYTPFFYIYLLKIQRPQLFSGVGFTQNVYTVHHIEVIVRKVIFTLKIYFKTSEPVMSNLQLHLEFVGNYSI